MDGMEELTAKQKRVIPYLLAAHPSRKDANERG